MDNSNMRPSPRATTAYRNAARRSDSLSTTLTLALAGVPVCPCVRGGNQPLTASRFLSASNDPPRWNAAKKPADSAVTTRTEARLSAPVNGSGDSPEPSPDSQESQYQDAKTVTESGSYQRLDHSKVPPAVTVDTFQPPTVRELVRVIDTVELGWLGEVDDPRTNHAAAEQKLTQMQRAATGLGMPILTHRSDSTE